MDKKLNKKRTKSWQPLRHNKLQKENSKSRIPEDRIKLKHGFNQGILERVTKISDDTCGSLKNNVSLLLIYFPLHDVPKNLCLHHNVMFE